MLLSSASGIFFSNGFAQEVVDYGVGERQNFSQTSISAPAPGNYQFKAILDSPDGTVSAVNVTFSPGPSATSPVSLNPFSANHTYNITLGNYASAGALTTDYPNSNYTMNITGPTNYAPVLAMANAQAYPGTVPTLTNTNWSGSNLVIDATQSFNFTWNGFASDSYSPTVVQQDIRLTIDPVSGSSVYDQTFASGAVDTSSILLTAGVLTPGATYTGHLIFSDYYTLNASLISGATGGVAYANRTNFTITAIPEPSTTALVLGFGMLAVALRKVRKRTAQVATIQQ